MCGHILNRFTAKQTNTADRISISFFLLQWLSFGYSSRVCCFVLFVHFWFLGQHFIIHHTTRQNIKSFHPLLDKELHSFPPEWCNFINICRTVGHWMLIQAMIYDIALILLRSELRSLSGCCILVLLSREAMQIIQVELRGWRQTLTVAFSRFYHPVARV